MKTGEHAVVWAEIPVLNFDRAKEFYEKIFEFEMYVEKMGAHHLGFLPMQKDSKGVGAAIVQGQDYTPSSLGSKVYLYGGDDLDEVLKRVEPADGKIIQHKKKITDEIGYFAVFEDTEGNHVCLHSMK